jgi:hypothetical protein
MGKRYTPYTWNPKRLGIQKSSNGPHENDVWLYLRDTTLDLVVQTNLNGAVLGSTVYRVRLPKSLQFARKPRRKPKAAAKRAKKSRPNGEKAE